MVVRGQRRAKIAALDGQRVQKEAELNTISATIDKLTAVIPTIQERVDIRKTLNEYGSKLQYFEVLQQLRRKSQVPVLMLTALGDETDRIAGLESGADDYLPKTFSTRELLARLRAVLRRAMNASATTEPKRQAPITVGDLWVDPEAHRVSLAGQPLTLTPAEYDILLLLVRAVGRVKTREQLLVEVADRDFESFDRAIDVHISSLRRKLGDDPKSPRFIETVRGAGYRMRKPGDERWD